MLQGKYPLREVVEVGRHLFSTPFTKAEGFGEGGKPDGHGGVLDGPREVLFRQKLDEFRLATHSTLDDAAIRDLLGFPKPIGDAHTKKIVFPYLRLNGLDSQSCFECHNAIGSERLPDARTNSLARKQSAVGGPAGFASNALINDDLPKHIFKFVRNPPHSFGTGYAQELAEEMTFDLHAERAQAVHQSLVRGNHKGSRHLRSKGTDYGMFEITYTGDPVNKPTLKAVLDQLNQAPNADPPGFVIDRAKIVGVSVDLVVRPFQWKGIASNQRNFVRDALQFHFGMEGREKNFHFGQSDENHDTDNDGIEDELSVGDVSALTIFALTIRPPVEVRPLKESDRIAVDRGRKLFEGAAPFTKMVSCGRCHTPSLRLDDSTVVVHDPFHDVEEFGPVELVGNRAGLSAQVKNSEQLPSVRRFMKLNPAAIIDRNGPEADSSVAEIRQARRRFEQSVVAAPDRRADGYAFDLNSLQPANFDPSANQQVSAPLSGSLPRLAESGETIQVPLFSDMRRHKMGVGLKEKDGFRQGTDVAGISVAEDEFLTRPLWGVADSGPWLHDGRAQSLEEATLLHESDQSEANDVIAAFRSLNHADKDALLKFMLSLRLPLDPRYGFDDYR